MSSEMYMYNFLFKMLYQILDLGLICCIHSNIGIKRNGKHTCYLRHDGCMFTITGMLD